MKNIGSAILLPTDDALASGFETLVRHWLDLARLREREFEADPGRPVTLSRDEARILSLNPEGQTRPFA